MNKVSIIIPTLCKSMDITTPILEHLQENENIESIIVIDNTLGQFTYTSPKILCYNKENLYVNPAWNKGLELCRTPYYLLLNDDVICSNETINACIHLMETNPTLVILGVKTENIVGVTPEQIKLFLEQNNQKKTPKYYLHGMYHNGLQRTGWFIFGRTAAWRPIPNTFVVFYGDDLIYYRNSHPEKQMGIITSYTIYHRVSTTINTNRKDYDPLLVREQSEYLKACRENK